MNYLKNLTKKKEPAPQEAPLLNPKPTGARNNTKDVEMNKPAEKQGFFANMKAKVQQNNFIQKTKKAAEAAEERAEESMNLSRMMPYIIVLCATGVFFIVVAFVYLPIVLQVPYKFCIMFFIGGMCLLCSAALVKKKLQFFKSLFEDDKLPWSIVYLSAIVCTILSAEVFHDNFFSLAFAIIQVISFGWLILIAVPGGRTLIRGVQTAIAKCCSCCFEQVMN